TGRSLERVRVAKELDSTAFVRATAPRQQIGPHRIEELACLDPEVAVGVARCVHECDAAGCTRSASSLESVASSDAVCRVWLELVSDCLGVCATLAIATFTCSTAVACCFVLSSISRAASVVVATSSPIVRNDAAR